MSLPIMLNLSGKKVLVVGGGKVGTRKAISLYESGAIVTILSINFTKELLDLSEKVVLQNKSFEVADITDYFLVIAATDNPEINHRVYQVCNDKKTLCQTVDKGNESDFDFMAKHRWQDLVVAVSTYGNAPKFSKSLIKFLTEEVKEEQLLQLKYEIEDRKKHFKKKK